MPKKKTVKSEVPSVETSFGLDLAGTPATETSAPRTRKIPKPRVHQKREAVLSFERYCDIKGLESYKRGGMKVYALRNVPVKLNGPVMMHTYDEWEKVFLKY